MGSNAVRRSAVGDPDGCWISSAGRLVWCVVQRLYCVGWCQRLDSRPG